MRWAPRAALCGATRSAKSVGPGGRADGLRMRIAPVLPVDVVEELVEARVAELVDRVAVDVPLVVRPVRLEPTRAITREYKGS